MSYTQLTSQERHTIATMRRGGFSIREIAQYLDRNPSTVSREVRRNGCRDGGYRWSKADSRARNKRRKSPRNKQFNHEVLHLVEKGIREDWSPRQVSGQLGEHAGIHISHQTIYTYIWDDLAKGGDLFKHLRCFRKRRRKRYGARDRRGRLVGKRMIETRPAYIESRASVGHWEMDTMLGKGSKHCVVTMVERATGYVMIGKLKSRTVDEINRVAGMLIRRLGFGVKTITADNGTEFHGYRDIEKMNGVTFYFANPHCAWERGTNENTNGLIRQYLHKGMDLRPITQADCDGIADKLNDRPRERLGFHTPHHRFIWAA